MRKGSKHTEESKRRIGETQKGVKKTTTHAMHISQGVFFSWQPGGRLRTLCEERKRLQKLQAYQRQAQKDRAESLRRAFEKRQRKEVIE